MKGLKLIIGLSILFILSCSKGDSVEIDCIDTKLRELNMVEYNGQEFGCKFFLHLYEYQNKQYFLLDNNCVDMSAEPIDCDGNVLCQKENYSECEKFFANAIRIGIIGIRE